MRGRNIYIPTTDSYRFTFSILFYFGQRFPSFLEQKQDCGILEQSGWNYKQVDVMALKLFVLPKTKNIQTTRQRSIAFSLEEMGAFSLTLLKMLMRTRNKVTSIAILPGTTSGFTKKLTQLTMTNMQLGRYTYKYHVLANIFFYQNFIYDFSKTGTFLLEKCK